MFQYQFLMIKIKFMLIFMFITLYFVFPGYATTIVANSEDKIHINSYIDNDGKLHVTASNSYNCWLIFNITASSNNYNFSAYIPPYDYLSNDEVKHQKLWGFYPISLDGEVTIEIDVVSASTSDTMKAFLLNSIHYLYGSFNVMGGSFGFNELNGGLDNLLKNASLDLLDTASLGYTELLRGDVTKALNKFASAILDPESSAGMGMRNIFSRYWNIDLYQFTWNSSSTASIFKKAFGTLSWVSGLPASTALSTWSIVSPIKQGIIDGKLDTVSIIDMNQFDAQDDIDISIPAARPYSFQKIDSVLSWSPIPNISSYLLTFLISPHYQSISDVISSHVIEITNNVTHFDLSQINDKIYATAILQAKYPDGSISDPTPVTTIDLSHSATYGHEFQSGDVGSAFWSARAITNTDGFRGEIRTYERLFYNDEKIADVDCFSISLEKDQILILDIDAKVAGAAFSFDGYPVGNANSNDFTYIPVPGRTSGLPSSLDADIFVYQEQEKEMILVEPAVINDDQYAGDPHRRYIIPATGTYYIAIYGENNTEGNYIFYKDIKQNMVSTQAPIVSILDVNITPKTILDNDVLYNGNNVLFTGEGVDYDGTIVSFFWDFGDGATATTINPTVEHFYSSGGSYAVTLSATDDDNETGNCSTQIDLYLPPIALITHPTQNNFFVNEIIEFAGEGIGFSEYISIMPIFPEETLIESYHWDFGDGTTSNEQYPEHVYFEPGSYAVSLYVKDKNDIRSDYTFMNIIVGEAENIPPTANIYEVKDISQPNAINFINTPIAFMGVGEDSDGSITSYFWDFGDGAIGNGSNVSHSYSSAGTYTVTLTVTDNNNATAIATIQVKIEEPVVSNTPPTALIKIEDDISIFVGSSTSFNGESSYDSDGYITSYYWDFGDGSTSNSMSPSHSYLYAGTYNAMLTVTDDQNATDTTTIQIVVKEEAPSLPDTITNSLGMTFNLIHSGTFIMGSPETESGRSNNETQHQVTLTQDYYIQTTEVTQAQWMAVMGSNPSFFNNCGSNCPVENISWNEAQEFIRRLNQRGEGSYLLPTEAQWEYAARAGSITAFANGEIYTTKCGFDENLNAIGWYCGNSNEATHVVAQKNPNAWGLYDMHGNVGEWCQDLYGLYPQGHITDPEGNSTGSKRISRGASYLDNAKDCRSADRASLYPDEKFWVQGFRLVRSQ